jgi:hypothetical protein
VEHRHAVVSGERHRQAIGDEDQGHEPVARGRLSVGLGEPGRRLREGAGAHRPSMPDHLAAVDLAPDQDLPGVDPQCSDQPPPVLPDAGVPGEPAEVQGLEGRFAYAAEPRAERRSGTR